MTEFNARYNLKLFLPQKIISIFEKCHLRPDNIYIEQKRMLFFNHLNVCKSLQACIYRINEHTSSSVFLSINEIQTLKTRIKKIYLSHSDPNNFGIVQVITLQYFHSHIYHFMYLCVLLVRNNMSMAVGFENATNQLTSRQNHELNMQKNTSALFFRQNASTAC